MTADEVAIATSESASADKTWSAVAVDARFDELIEAVDDWSADLQAGLGTNRRKYDQAFGATRSFWQAPMDKDLYDMAYEINRLVAHQTIKTSSQRVMAPVPVAKSSATSRWSSTRAAGMSATRAAPTKGNAMAAVSGEEATPCDASLARRSALT